jgi:hypothetical protein
MNSNTAQLYRVRCCSEERRYNNNEWVDTTTVGNGAIQTIERYATQSAILLESQILNAFTTTIETMLVYIPLITSKICTLKVVRTSWRSSILVVDESLGCRLCRMITVIHFVVLPRT